MRPGIAIVERERSLRFRPALRGQVWQVACPYCAAQQCPGEQAVSLTVTGRDRDGASAQSLCLGIRLARALPDRGQRADHAFPGVEAVGRLTLATDVLGPVKLGL